MKQEEGIDDGVRVAQGRKGSGVACCDLTTHEEVAAAAGQDDREISFSRAGVSSTLTRTKTGEIFAAVSYMPLRGVPRRK